ncbi:hypothetical protein BX600DRAFT_319982 [Xylariales sp. PMI_506]|nr:hypothetical protein BX600DRAFT_319982 [Xylariales sp. PMI_506]
MCPVPCRGAKLRLTGKEASFLVVGLLPFWACAGADLLIRLNQSCQLRKSPPPRGVWPVASPLWRPIRSSANRPQTRIPQEAGGQNISSDFWPAESLRCGRLN